MDRLPASLQWLLAALAAAAATGLCALLDRHMSVAGLAMVYLLAVVITSAALDRGAATVASLLCVSALNFFVPPRYSFEIDGAEYWWTLAVLLGLSLGIGSLVADLRRRRARAELGEARTARLHALGETLAQAGDDPVELARRAAQWLHAETGHACAVLLRDAPAGTPRAIGSPEHGRFDASAAAWTMDEGRPLGRGWDDWPDLPLWCVPFGRAPAAGAVQVLLPLREPLPDGTHEHWGMLARQVALSVDRARAARDARTAQEEARAEHARNTLLAALSHDLRTPLAGIAGSASTLRTLGDRLSAPQRDKLLTNLEDEARDMTLMADNILQMARLSQPHTRLKAQWESLEEILGAALARLRARWPQAHIQLRVRSGLPPIQAEAALLAQVIANLADNAMRHSTGPHPQITIRAGRSRQGVFLAVRDFGAGLAPGDPALLFERFRQGSAAGGSAGLGLAICQLVVQAHGGRIDARRCEPGTEFRIDLPVQAAASCDVAVA